MIHRHIKQGYESSVVAVEDILERGSVEDWRELANKVQADPHGKEAKAVETVVNNVHIYGTSILWKMLLKKWRNKEPQKGQERHVERD